jgi:hypothetical protein
VTKKEKEKVSVPYVLQTAVIMNENSQNSCDFSHGPIYDLSLVKNPGVRPQCSKSKVHQYVGFVTALCGTTGAVSFFLFWQVFTRTAALSSILNCFPSKWAHSIRIENPQRMEYRYF